MPLSLLHPIFCRKATAIIAVSEASKRDLVRSYDVDPAKVTVVYEAATAHFKPPAPAGIAHARRTYHLPERFLLHLGTIEPRKNLMRLLDAFQAVLERTQKTKEHHIDFERFSISERISELVDRLRVDKRLVFHEIFEPDTTRAELIITFLAILEMTRLRLGPGNAGGQQGAQTNGG